MDIEHDKKITDSKVNVDLTMSSDKDCKAIIVNKQENMDDYEIYETWTFLGEPMKNIKFESINNKNNNTVFNDNDHINDNHCYDDVKIDNNDDNQLDLIEECRKCDVGVIVCETFDGNNTTDIDDESDGISIISETDWSHRCSPQINNIDKINSFDLDTQQESNYNEQYNTLERHNNCLQQNLQNSLKVYQNNYNIKNCIILGLVTALSGILLGQIYISNNTHDSKVITITIPLVKRIKELELENIALKTKIKFLNNEKSLPSAVEEQQFIHGINIFPDISHVKERHEKGRKVWSGGSDNIIEPLIIPLKKRKFDYCGDTENEDDLFSEYNEKICRKRFKKVYTNKSTQTVNVEPTLVVSSSLTPELTKTVKNISNKMTKTLNSKKSNSIKIEMKNSTKSPQTDRPKLERQKNVVEKIHLSSTKSNLKNNKIQKLENNKINEHKKSATNKILKNLKKKTGNDINDNSFYESVQIDIKKLKNLDVSERENNIHKKIKKIKNDEFDIKKIDADWYQKMMKSREKVRTKNWYFELGKGRENLRQRKKFII